MRVEGYARCLQRRSWVCRGGAMRNLREFYFRDCPKSLMSEPNA
jgi:hypothetical protein